MPQKLSGKEHGLSGSTLKYIAIITMLIDHFGAAFFIVFTSFYAGTACFAQADILYQVMRGIGRTAFPIFCFVLVEGLYHTHDVKRYLLRLFAFALVSEIPFDLALSDRILEFGAQNVFFTLFLGLLVIMAADRVMERFSSDNLTSEIGRITLLVVIGMVGCALASYVISCDYGASGVIAIYIMYLLRSKRELGFALAVVSLGVFSGELELLALLMLIPLHFYNGTRGKQHKYFFYAFYPLHLLLLALIAWGLGLGI